MSERDYELPDNVDRTTLDRLYDDPDEAIGDLLSDRPDDDIIDGQYTVFQALANRDRLRLLEALRHEERCGCELVAILDAPQSTVATHLRNLREAGVVKSRKKGKWNYYRIADTAVLELLDLGTALESE